jgi:outer membrane protein OmpA-like peptidoglycan-associated protein
LVIDSGVQTIGDLPLSAPGVLNVDPDTISSSLKENGSLASLQGVDVLVTGLGSTYAPQKQIAQRYVTKLEALWKSVFIAAGVDARNYVDDASPLPPTPPAKGLPTVKTIVFHDVSKPPPPGPDGGGGGDTCTLRLRADQVGFVANEDTFVNKSHARSVLKPMANILTTHRPRKQTVTLTGTTAVPETDPKSPHRLSLQRAYAVERVLLSLGVQRSQVTAVYGVGTNFPGFVHDTDAKGNLIEALAIQNRLVIIRASVVSNPNCT